MKTWLTALFCVVRCILFPQTKICVASGTREQGNDVLLKITEDFMKNYHWGSDNLKREIESSTIGANKAEIVFKNGSWIKVVTASDSARGKRANVLIIDEFRLVDKDTIDTVLKRFMGNARQPSYLSLPEYKGKDEYLETNIEIYMSSAWMKSHWSFEKSKAYTVNLLGGREGYFVCALPYQMSIKEGLKKRVEIEDEMSEIDFDATKFAMEMECIPFGNFEGSFYDFDDVDKQRKLNIAVYPPDLTGKIKNLKVPDLIPNERRILSVDIALMASKKNKNDASSIIINSAIPTGNSFVGNIVYLENKEDILTNELALRVRQLFDWYKCTDLVIDANGVGMGTFDLLVQDMVDYKTGKIYPALSCCNNEIMAARCKVADAPKVIWSVKATDAFNSEISILLRNGFMQGKLNLLVSEYEAEDILNKNIDGYSKMETFEQTLYKMPYVQTTLLIYELIKLDAIGDGKKVKLKEKSGNRKDRYSSLAYNYWVQCELEREKLRVAKSGFDPLDYANKLHSLAKRPNMY